MNNDDIKKFINISNLYSEVEIEKTNKVDEGILDWLEDKLGINKDQAEKVVDEIPADAKEDLDKVVDDNNLSKIDPLKLANPKGDADENVEPRPTENADGNDPYDIITSRQQAEAGTPGAQARLDRGLAELKADQATWDKENPDAYVPVDDAGQDNNPNTDGGQNRDTRQGQDNNPNTDGGQNRDTRQGQDNQPNADDGSVDAVGSEEDPTVTDQEGGVAQGIDQADAADDTADDGSVDAVGSEEDPTANIQDPTGNVGGKDAADKAAADAQSDADNISLDTTAKTAEPANTKDLMTRYNEGGKKAMPEIKKLQTELSRLGFDPNGIDGKYGNGTYAAVQAFQKANGLTVDGQAGTNTLAAIEKAINPNAGSGKDADGVPLSTVAPGTGKDGPAGGAKPLPKGQDQSPEDGVEPEADPNDPMTSKNQQRDIDTAQPNADLARYIELLNKLEGGQQNAGTPNATQGRVVASYDFRDLMTLVENKLLNEQLTKAEMEELKALHNKVQGHVGIDLGLDDKITTQLNRYLKLVKEPENKASANQSRGAYANDPQATDPNARATRGSDSAFANDPQATDPNARATRGSDSAFANDPQAAAPKVSKEVHIQGGGGVTNFNIGKMKKKYPKVYLDIPQKDGNVTRGYGPLVNLQAYKKKNPAAKIAGQKQAGTPNAELDGKYRGVQTASKDNNMKKAIKEASMNISINGDSAAEVAELAGILKNAGMSDATPVSDILPRPGEKPAISMDPPAHMDGHDDMVSKMRMMDEPGPDDSPCGMGEEGVEEDSWDNSPDETYADTQTMTKDLSGGLNRQKKSYPKVAGGDNPMAIETSIKEQLWAALNEKMTEGGSRGTKKKLKASRGNEDIKTTEGSKGKKSRGKKSRG